MQKRKGRERKIKIQTQEQEQVKRTYGKCIFEGREDGGPRSRSKGTPVQTISASYASVVKNEKSNLHPKIEGELHTQEQN